MSLITIGQQSRLVTYCSETSCKLPIIVSQNVCQSSRLQPLCPSQLYRLYKSQKVEKNVFQRVEESEALVNRLTDDLRAIKSSIDEAFQNQIQTQLQIDKCPPREKLEELLQLKCRQQQDLMECLNLEDKYLKKLHCAQRNMREAHVQKQSFGLQLVYEKIDNVYQMYKNEKDIRYQNRLYRECTTKDNITRNNKKYQFQAMKDYLSTSLDKNLVNLEQNIKPKRRTLAMKDAMKKIRIHIRNTNLRHRNLKEEAHLKNLIRQTHQRQNLVSLKQKIDETLCLQTQIQKKKTEQQERKKEIERQALIDERENPYVVDELLKVQEKLQQNEIQVMQCKTLALQKIESEIALNEKKRQTDLIKKKKWDKYWAQKVAEKKRQHYNKYIRPFLAQPSTASRQERWLKIAQDIYGYDSTGQKLKKHDVTSLPVMSSDRGNSEGSESDKTNGDDSTGKEIVDTEQHHHRRRKKVKQSTTGKLSRLKNHGSANSSASERSSTERSKIKTISTTVQDSAKPHTSGITGNKKSKKKMRRTGQRSTLSNDDRLSIEIDDLFHEQEEMIDHVLPPRNLLSEHSMDGKCDKATTGHLDKLSMLNYNLDLPSKSTKIHKRQLGNNVSIFSWSPKIISFKNFEIGKVYKIKVFVTNKSKQRVKYYFKNISEQEQEQQISLNLPITAEWTPSHHTKNKDGQVLSGVLEEGSQINRNNDIFDDQTQQHELQPTYTTWPLHQLKNLETKLMTKKKKGKRTKLSIPNESGRTSDRDHHQQLLASDKLKEVEMKYYNLTDLIKIDFIIPSPIYPGLQHSFLVRFSPKVIGNWSGSLHFTSEMQNFDIPISIRKKVFSPQLELSFISFSDTVVQTNVIKKVKITNIGALSGSLVAINELNPPKHFSEMEYYASKVNEEEGSIGAESSGEKGEEANVSDLSRQNRNSARSKDDTDRNKHGKKQGRKKKSRLDTHVGKQGQTKTNLNTTGLLKSGKKNSPLNGIKKKQNLMSSVASTKSQQQFSQVDNIVKNILDTLIFGVTDSVFLCYAEEMRRVIEPGESLTLCILYRPPFVSHFVTKYDFSFEQESGEPVDNLSLEVTGKTLEHPVYIQPLNGDFRICSINQTYQLAVQAFTIAHKGSGKVSARVPHALRGIIDVHPHEGTISATHPCQFAIRFSPKKQILASPDRYQELFDPETNIIDFPIDFHLKFSYKVPSPIRATFMGIITGNSLVVEPLEIDVGYCLNNETVKAQLTVYNPTSVIQQFGFVELPEEILVQPNYGFGSVFPDETIKMDVLLSVDKIEGPHSFHMKLQTFTKEEYVIQIKCNARYGLAKLSHNKIFFPVTCCGSTSTTFFGIKASPKLTRNNLQFSKFVIEWNSSHQSFLKFVPNSGYLEPGKEQKIMVIFEANVTNKQVRDHYVEMARKLHVERVNSYKRELASINLHIRNDWMLEENPNISILESRTSLLPRVVESSGSSNTMNLPLRQQFLATIEKRKALVMAKLEEPFIPPSVEHMSSESVEFAKTKRNLMRNLIPTTNVLQVPIFIQDDQLGTDILYLTVKCPVQKPDLNLLDDSPFFNFGKVQVGSSVCKEISLHNISSTYLTLKMDILNPYGPFIQINSLRDLAPDHVYILKIRFEPLQLGDYEESIVIYGLESRITITLVGSCYDKVVESIKTNVTNLESKEVTSTVTTGTRVTPPYSTSLSTDGKSKRKKKHSKKSKPSI